MTHTLLLNLCVYIYIYMCVCVCDINSGRLPYFPTTPAVVQIDAGELKVLLTASEWIGMQCHCGPLRWTKSTFVIPQQVPASQKQTFKSYPRRQRMPHRGPSQQGGNLHKRDDRNTCDPKPTISSDRLWHDDGTSHPTHHIGSTNG